MAEAVAPAENGTRPLEDMNETEIENNKEDGNTDEGQAVEKAEATEVEEEQDSKDGKESAKDGDDEEKGTEEFEKKNKETKEVKVHKKRGRKSKKPMNDGDVKDKEVKEMLNDSSTPIISPVERPLRERKSIQRFVVSNEKEPVKEVFIEKGSGTPLKDIPNVAYKLSKRKTDETLKALHLILFGRRGKAFHMKSVISQFSGFVWNENREKQRTKVKEKLDKYNKDHLLDFCEVLDIPFSRATNRKEDVVTKLLEFLESPRAMSDVLLADKEQSNKSKKRKRQVKGSASKKPGSASARGSAKKQILDETPKTKVRKSASKTEDEDEENGVIGGDDYATPENSELEGGDEPEEEDDDDYGKNKRKRKGSSRNKSSTRGSAQKYPKRNLVVSPSKIPKKTPVKRTKAEDSDDGSPRPKRKKNDGTAAKKPSTPSKSTSKGKTKEKTVERKAKGKDKSGGTGGSGPTEEELRTAICDILKVVDFSTATFTDILKKLAAHYDMDLSRRKAKIKLMIQEELTRLADEAEENEEGEEEERSGDKSDKEEEKVKNSVKRDTGEEEARNTEKMDELEEARSVEKAETAEPACQEVEA